LRRGKRLQKPERCASGGSLLRPLDALRRRCFLNAPEIFCEKPCQFAAGPLYW